MNIAFLLLILFLPFIYLEPGILFPALGTMHIALLIALTAFLAAFLSGIRIPKCRQNKMFGLLLLIALVSILLSPVPRNVLSEKDIYNLVKAIAFFSLVSIIIKERNYLDRYFYITLFFGALVAITSILTVRAGIHDLKGGQLYRMRNYFGGLGDDPNEFAALMIAMLPLSVCMIRTEMSKVKKIVYAIMSLGFLLAIIRTRSRGAFIGLAVILVMLVWDHKRQFGTILAILLMLVYAFFHTHAGYMERMSSAFSQEKIESDYNANSRLDQYRHAVEMIGRYPLNGVGVGNFKAAKIYLLGIDPSSKDAYLVPHNTYLGICAEIGVFGLFVFLAIVYVTFRELRYAERLFSRSRDSEKYFSMAKGVRIGFIGFCVAIFFLSEPYNLMFYQMVALSVVLRRKAEALQEPCVAPGTVPTAFPGNDGSFSMPPG